MSGQLFTGQLFDSFTRKQEDDTPNVGPDPSWGPSSRRSTFSSNNGSSTINVSTSGWTVNTGTIPNSISGISYTYVNAINFTPLLRIVIGGDNSPSYGRLRLLMRDGTSSQSLAPNTTTSKQAVWNLSSFTNINKSHITFISITLATASTTAFVIRITAFNSDANTIITTLGDNFTNDQGPTNITNTIQYIPGQSTWKPETSSRQIRISNTSFVTDINRFAPRVWRSTLPAAGVAALTYISAPTTFNLIDTSSSLSTVIGIDINTNAVLSSITLTMFDNFNRSHAVPNSIPRGKSQIIFFLEDFTSLNLRSIVRISFTITNLSFSTATFNASNLIGDLSFFPPTFQFETVDDFFNTSQQAAGEPNTLEWSSELPVGWNPANSNRILGGDAPEFIDSDINITTDGEWSFTIRAGNNAQLSYRAFGGPYDMHLLLSISVVDLTLDNGNGNLQLTLNDSSGGTETVTKLITDAETHTYTFPVSDFIGVDLFKVTLIRFTINNLDEEGNDSASGSAAAISSILICVAKDTMILMANGAKKAIQDIVRGDMVVGSGGKIYNRVARVIHNKLPGATPVSLVTIEKDAIGKNKPDTKLIISASHPILYDGARHPAQRFRKFPGITYYGKKGTVASDVLPVNEDGTYSLYNIQYEHDGYFVANGVTVDSLPVMSSLAPLPKELFFDQKLYNKPSTVKVAPLDKDFVKPPKK